MRPISSTVSSKIQYAIAPPRTHSVRFGIDMANASPPIVPTTTTPLTQHKIITLPLLQESTEQNRTYHSTTIQSKAAIHKERPSFPSPSRPVQNRSSFVTSHPCRPHSCRCCRCSSGPKQQQQQGPARTFVFIRDLEANFCSISFPLHFFPHISFVPARDFGV